MLFKSLDVLRFVLNIYFKPLKPTLDFSLNPFFRVGFFLFQSIDWP
jgi:hypothetical protein